MPAATSRASRDATTWGDAPERACSSSKRRTPRNASRTRSIVQRSPRIAMARATEQFWSEILSHRMKLPLLRRPAALSRLLDRPLIRRAAVTRIAIDQPGHEIWVAFHLQLAQRHGLLDGDLARQKFDPDGTRTPHR